MSHFFHRNLVAASAEALRRIFEENRYADRVIETTLKQNPKWGGRDRRFIAETTYDVVRYWRLVLTCGEIASDDPQKFMKAIATWFALQQQALPDWLAAGVDVGRILDNARQNKDNRPVSESIPDWLDEQGMQELPLCWSHELHALNQEAPVVLRVNTLRSNKEEVAMALKEAGVDVEAVENVPDAWVLQKRTNVFRLPSFKEGWFELQDASSQLVAPFLQVLPGMRVVDACAGAGGKTLHLAALMKNKGRLIALDTELWKLQELKRRSRRAGAGTIEVRNVEGTKTIKRLHDSADRLLLDVPCSGVGVLRRNPDAKWKLTAAFMMRIRDEQQSILNSYARMVKPGGKMVYATCSIFPSENQQQVQTFLQSHSEFELEEARQVLPSEGFDGFYMARLRKR